MIDPWAGATTPFWLEGAYLLGNHGTAGGEVWRTSTGMRPLLVIFLGLLEYV